jgi:hypothetical protein
LHRTDTVVESALQVNFADIIPKRNTSMMSPSPHRCKLEPLANGQMGAVAIDCDRVVFYGDSLTLPAGAPIVAFSQKYSGQQALPTQVSTYGEEK